MSRKTIRACDLMCEVMNWRGSLKNAFEDEGPRWQKKHDKAYARLKKMVAEFTPHEIAFIRKRAPRFIEQLGELDVFLLEPGSGRETDPLQT